MTEYVAELSIKLGCEEREYMARWLALEVLMTDELARQDQELYDALSRFQEAQEKDARQRYGLDSEELGTEGETRMTGSQPLDVPARMLCPSCCTIDDILAIEQATVAGALPQVACARCAFTFPVLPPEGADLTLIAMREHDCLIPGERGNWDAVGKEINGQMRLKGFSQGELSRRLREQGKGEKRGNRK